MKFEKKIISFQIRPTPNNDEAKKGPITPTWRKAGTPMASPAKVGFLVSFLVIIYRQSSVKTL